MKPERWAVPGLEYIEADDGSGEYFWRDEPVTRMSELLRVGIDGGKPFHPYYGQRGRAVHRACELHDDGDLHWTCNDACGNCGAGVSGTVYEPFIAAWIRWRELARVDVLATESMVTFDTDYGRVAGRFDRILHWNGGTYLADIKTKGKPGKPDARTHRRCLVQLCGYLQGLRETGRSMAHEAAAAIYLHGDGTATPVIYTAAEVKDGFAQLDCVIETWGKALIGEAA